MLGAIVGDIIGSPYESRLRRIKTKDFPLFSAASHFTDDTVTTLAIGAAIIEAKENKTGYTQRFCDQMKYWCRKYPEVGFGRCFIEWFMGTSQAPYGSYGNGAAMRVSPVAWAGRTLAEVQSLAELTAVVSHNHPEAIKGAVAVATAIYLARKGQSKDEIRAYMQYYFYPLDKHLVEIRPDYHFSSRTKDSVPQAIECFLESRDFEDAVRNAVSLGGDSDTQAAIAGSIAEAFYGGVPEPIWNEAAKVLTPDLLQLVHVFQDQFMKDSSI